MAWAGMASRTGQTAGRIDRNLAAEGGGALRRSCSPSPLGAQAEVLVPVEFQCGGQVVDLGQADVLRADAGLGVGRVEDLVLEHAFRRGPRRRWNPLRYRQFG